MFRLYAYTALPAGSTMNRFRMGCNIRFNGHSWHMHFDVPFTYQEHPFFKK